MSDHAHKRRSPCCEAEALRYLASDHRILAIIVPRGVDEEDIKALSREVNERLDALVERRGMMS